MVPVGKIKTGSLDDPSPNNGDPSIKKVGDPEGMNEIKYRVFPIGTV